MEKRRVKRGVPKTKKRRVAAAPDCESHEVGRNRKGGAGGASDDAFSCAGIKKRRSKADFASTWWRRVDSNHRSETQQIYSLPPLATRELLHIQLTPDSIQQKGDDVETPRNQQWDGAGGRTRTPDLLITNQLLYQLSYTSVSAASAIQRGL